jgi:hypothetical protein
MERLFDLEDPKTWKPVITAIGEALPSGVKQKLTILDGDSIYEDDVGFLEVAYAEAGHGFDEETQREIGDTILGAIGCIRGFHACRTTALDRYFEHGIEILTEDRLAAIIHALVPDRMQLAELVGLVRQANLSSRKGVVCFASSSIELTQFAGHYLIRGPEALNVVWKGASGEQRRHLDEFDKRLLERGTSTLFECSVPVEWMRDGFQDELWKTVLVRWLQRRANPNRTWDTNWGFQIVRDLPPERILYHTHPSSIIDSRNWGAPFENQRTTCPHCARGTG